MKTVDPKAAAPVETGREKTSATRSPSETTTLVCAVSLAVALGVACGAWINVRLASAAAEASSTASAVVMRLRPPERADARNATAPPAVTEPTPVEHQDTNIETDEASPSDVPPEAGRPGADADEASDKVSAESRRGPAPSGDEASPSARAFGTRGGAAGVLKKDGGVVKKDGGAAWGAKKATAGHGRVAPCGLYASANSLSVRGGGAATLILGGPGEAGRITVTTPNWSDIAVFSEGRVGDKGWVRYSVRSVSKRAGVYVVRFTTPCGSHNIPVTVTRP